MERAVRAQPRPAGRELAALEGRAAAAGLLDDEPDGGVVPQLRARVGGDVERRPRRPGSAARSRSRPRIAQARRTTSAQPDGISRGAVVEATQSSTRATAETRHRSPVAANAPARRAPPTSGGRAPAPTRRATSTTPSRSSASSVAPHRDAAHVVHRPVDRVDDPARVAPPSSPNSSPSTPSPGRSRATRARIASSAARSASETGVRSGFVSTDEVARAEARQRDRVGRVGERVREGEVGARGSSRSACLEREPGGEHERVRRRAGRRAAPTPAARPRPARTAARAPASRAALNGYVKRTIRSRHASSSMSAGGATNISVGVSSRSTPSSASSARRSVARARAAAAASASRVGHGEAALDLRARCSRRTARRAPRRARGGRPPTSRMNAGVVPTGSGNSSGRDRGKRARRRLDARAHERVGVLDATRRRPRRRRRRSPRPRTRARARSISSTQPRDVARHRPDVVEARREREDAVDRHEPERRLEARRSPQHAAGMRIEPPESVPSADVDEPGRERRRRAAARAARRAARARPGSAPCRSAGSAT